MDSFCSTWGLGGRKLGCINCMGTPIKMLVLLSLAYVAVYSNCMIHGFKTTPQWAVLSCVGPVHCSCREVISVPNSSSDHASGSVFPT